MMRTPITVLMFMFATVAVAATPKRPELDFVNVPFQKKNVIKQYAERAAAMRSQWKAWNQEHPELPFQGQGS